MDDVGSDPEAALNALQMKRLRLTYVAAGGEISQIDNHPVTNGEKMPVSKAVVEDAADEISQEQVNNGALAAFVQDCPVEIVHEAARVPANSQESAIS